MSSCEILIVFKIRYVMIYNHHSTKISEFQIMYNTFAYLLFLNTLRLRWNGHHLTNDIFKCIFLNENVWIPIKISLKFVPKGPINNIPTLVQIMAWRHLGDKPLSESMMVSLPMDLCVTQSQWVNYSKVWWASYFWAWHALPAPIFIK